MIPGKAYKPEDILQMAWRRKWFIVAPLILAAFGAEVYARRLPDRYRSETVILVVPQRVPESYVRSTITTRIGDRLPSITQQVLSRTRIERIIQDFELYPDLRSLGIMEDVVEQMRRDIDIQTARGDSFKIAYVSDQPRRAMQVTERLASLFIDESLKDREVLAEGTNQFLETQLEDARRRLIENEKKLEMYRREHGGELPTQVDSNLQAMNGAQLQLQALEDSVNRDRDRRLILERRAADLSAQEADVSQPTETPVELGTVEQPGAQGGTHAQQLDAARKLLQDLELRLKPTHPDIKRVKRVIADLEKKAEADAAVVELAVDKGGKSRATAMSKRDDLVRQARQAREEIDNIDRQTAEKETQKAKLKTVIAEYQRRVEAAPTRQSDLVELTRDYTMLQSLYSGLLAKNEEAKISANLERRQIGEQFRVLDPPRLPARPFSPNRTRIVQLGAFFGVGFGLALAALLEYRDTTLKTDEDVITALALPVLALIPIMRSGAEQQRLRRRTLLISAVSATAVLGGIVLFVVWKLKAGL